MNLSETDFEIKAAFFDANKSKLKLKKEQKQGLNGSFELITGYPMNNGLAANMNYRHKKVNFFIEENTVFLSKKARIYKNTRSKRREDAQIRR